MGASAHTQLFAGLSNTVQDVLQKLLNAEYAAAGLEQAQHGKQSIFNARINDKA